MNISTTPQVQYLQRPEGRVSYTVEGSGPLVVAVPGMGDLRSTYRELTRPLVEAGYRVAVTDLRAHGDSDTTFRTFGDIATGEDVIALIEELGGPAVVLGNSMGAAAAAWAAAERPDLVAGLVLYGPLLRDPAMSRAAVAAMHAMYRVLFAGFWGAGAWAGYYEKTVNRGRKAPWLPEQVAAIRANLKEPGRLRSFRRLTLQLTHSVVEPRLPEVHAPMLAFIGELDPDFRDPKAELDWIASLGAETEFVSDAAHYPQAQRPDVTVPRTLAFLAGRRDGSEWATGA
ncbi:alpha/beta fold hydrolase [Leifsonia sp. AG29]|uniref:alpha/beta fold hydrolase n=1 Tax=Leifsonia sp. AG29 TaxID=2598860 RepID=UPI00131C9F70|nr:alpha/beta hydrolase [Leifsonia sp. AG29]